MVVVLTDTVDVVTSEDPGRGLDHLVLDSYPGSLDVQKQKQQTQISLYVKLVRESTNITYHIKVLTRPIRWVQYPDSVFGYNNHYLEDIVDLLGIQQTGYRVEKIWGSQTKSKRTRDVGWVGVCLFGFDV